MSGNAKRRLLLAILVLAPVACDRATKHVASVSLADQPPQSYLLDTVRLSYSKNTGGFLSLGSDLPESLRILLFVVFTGVMLVVVVVVALQSRWNTWQMVGLSLFVAGGLSNWIDRVVQGYVVDFLNLGIGPVRTGVFNIADVALMAGGGILLLSTSRSIREE